MSLSMIIRVGLAMLQTPTVTAAVEQRHPATTPHRALASWYNDGGQTASGRHYNYGFASLMFGSEWGKRIRFRHGRRVVIGRLDDHGPYVYGRSYDLDWRLKTALGCGDLCYVRWGYVR